MNNDILSADEVTEEQARAEIARIQAQIAQLFEQMKREREEGLRVTARTDATMARVQEGLKQLLSR